ncbi:MAG: hypothetical protein KGQ52_11400 [Alphaproteobacteria bacterium]|nr:hypothetical protein [Alphaproteobacteria bacterium]
MRRPLLLAAALLAVAPPPALAQIAFADPDGRYTELTGPGVVQLPLGVSGMAPADFVRRFQALCLSGSLEPARITAAAAASGWAATPDQYRIPFTGPLYDEPVHLWSGGGQTLLVAAKTIGRPRGGFGIHGPQCALLTLAGDYTQDTMAPAISAALGTGPTNAAEAMREGKPNRAYRPHWAVDVPGVGFVS